MTMTVTTLGSYSTQSYPQNIVVSFDDVTNMYTFIPNGDASRQFDVSAVVMSTLLNDLNSALPMGSDVVGANGDLVITIPEGYYDGLKTVTAGDTALIPANIVHGEVVFGVTGT